MGRLICKRSYSGKEGFYSFYLTLFGGLAIGFWYIATAGPHILHYLSYNIHIPGLWLITWNYHQTVSELIHLHPNFIPELLQSRVKEKCHGCNLLRPFTGQGLEDIFIQMNSYQCRKVRVFPQNHLCLRPYSGDQISFAWMMFGYYEMHYRNALMEIFDLYPNAGLIDLGCNIGSHTLLVTKLGHPVVAVDANPVNLKMLHMAAELDGVSHLLKSYWNAVSNERGNITMEWKRGENLEGNTGRCASAITGTDCNDQSLLDNHRLFRVPSVTLDDLSHVIRESPTRTWIVKVDIEGQESLASTEADQFFNSSYFSIPIVMMEYRTTLNENADLAVEMAKRFYDWGYCPYSYTPFMFGYFPIYLKDARNWPHDILLIKQPNSCNNDQNIMPI